jgi:hypothetical protein
MNEHESELDSKIVGSRFSVFQRDFRGDRDPSPAKSGFGTLDKAPQLGFQKKDLLIFRPVDHNLPQSPIERLHFFINIRDALGKSRNAAGVEIGGDVVGQLA